MRPEKKKKKDGQNVSEMRRRAKILLRMLDDEGSQLCIPSVVVAELLLGVEPHKHANVIAEFQERLFCPPFDIKACVLSAKLWHFERGLQGHSEGLPKEEQTERKILKADILIVASAKVGGATIFYSHEKKCRRLATEAGMATKDLPTSSGDWVTDLDVENEEKGERDA
jgi:predicted nucleic acid-binding protein